MTREEILQNEMITGEKNLQARREYNALRLKEKSKKTAFMSSGYVHVLAMMKGVHGGDEKIRIYHNHTTSYYNPKK